MDERIAALEQQVSALKTFGEMLLTALLEANAIDEIDYSFLLSFVEEPPERVSILEEAKRLRAERRKRQRPPRT